MLIPEEETLTALASRHIALIIAPFSRIQRPWRHNMRLLKQLTSVQIDLMCFHSQNDQAMRLNTQLARLAADDLEEAELVNRLLALLRQVV